jgi:hypothetical protein
MRSFPYPHHVDKERKVVSIYFVSGFPATMAAAYLVKEHFPGYTAEIVSASRLEKLQNQ